MSVHLLHTLVVHFLLLTAVGFAVTASDSHVQRAAVKYRHFDEYLLHLNGQYQALIVEEMTTVEFGVEKSQLFEKPLPIRTGVKHNKEEQCCMLGHLAGEKGFHCVSRFYAARLLPRNYNRAHNKKVAAIRKGKPYADKLMRTFEQCVLNRRGTVFHKCCRHAALH